MSKDLKVKIAIIGAVLLVVLSFIAGCQAGRGTKTPPPPADTIRIHTIDTLRIASAPDTVTTTVTRYLSVPVYIRDTDTIREPVTVPLPFEQHFAKIDDVADVWFSGFQPKIDSAVVYKKHTTEIVNHYIKEPAAKNMVGVSAGMTDASLMYLRRIGPVWLGASAGYTYDGNATARGIIAFQF